jgi:hypothetical protein
LTYTSGSNITLINPIKLNESGVEVTSSLMVWTGTGITGAKTTNAVDWCNSWDSKLLGASGSVGLLGTTASTWTENTTNYDCGSPARLYCFEQ